MNRDRTVKPTTKSTDARYGTGKRVLFLTIGHQKTPSTRFRVKQYFPLFAQEGWVFRHVPIPHATLQRLSMFPSIRWASVIFLQKKLFSALELSVITRFKRPIIFDMDDVIFHEHPIAFDRKRIAKQLSKNQKRFQNTIEHSSKVIVGNEFLAQYVRALGKEPVIIPTPVDTHRYSPQNDESAVVDGDAEQRQPVIGWIGTKRNLYYLQSIAEALRKVQDSRPDVVIEVISDGILHIDGLTIRNIPWKAEEEVEKLRHVTIGIMPLTDDLYSQGKCGFKLLQYMSMALPTVSSPIGVNSQIVSHGQDGLLADSPEQWTHYLLTLLHNSEKRKKLGEAARRKVEQQYSVQALFPRLAAVLDSL